MALTNRAMPMPQVSDLHPQGHHLPMIPSSKLDIRLQTLGTLQDTSRNPISTP